MLELKADFTAARMHRANVYFKLAQYVNAKEDYLQVVSIFIYLLHVKYIPIPITYLNMYVTHDCHQSREVDNSLLCYTTIFK